MLAPMRAEAFGETLDRPKPGLREAVQSEAIGDEFDDRGRLVCIRIDLSRFDERRDQDRWNTTARPEEVGTFGSLSSRRGRPVVEEAAEFIISYDESIGAFDRTSIQQVHDLADHRIACSHAAKPRVLAV